MTTYEVHALRYATREVHKSAEYHRFGVYGEADEPVSMAYYLWLIRNGERTVLLDTGFDRERAARRPRIQDVDPVELLARMDVAPADVDHVVVSHMHFDHIGNLGLFPNATVSVAREELEFWTGPIGRKPLYATSVEPVEIELVRRLEREGRLSLVDGDAELFPGIGVSVVGGHTPGQLVTEIATDTGQVVLASDSVHFYEELERDRPFATLSDLAGMYRAYELLRELDARPDTTVVAGHDPRDATTYAEVVPDCFDLTSR